MRSLVLTTALAAAAVASLAVSACLMEASNCTFDGTCAAAPNGAEAGADGSSGGPGPVEPPVPAGCDVNADAKDSLPCAATSFALFVNADAPAGGDGSKEKPFRAIQGAIDAVAKTGKHRIYICGSATYAEHLEMKAATYARLLGGFECAGWTPAEPKPRVAPSDAGYALHIDAVPSEVRIEDVAFEAIAGTAASRSSIGVFVASSPNVLFKRATVKANAGLDGADGVVGGINEMAPPSGQGFTGEATKGAGTKTCTCALGGTSIGGQGGDTVGGAVSGTNGLPTITPVMPANATGTAQSNAGCNGNTGFAQNGSDGKNGTDAPIAAIGLLNSSAWSPGNGESGTRGDPGQGGGGGGALTVGGIDSVGGGGGGGCGGCGGGPGTGGTAGGSSVAMLAFESPIKVVDSSLTASPAGKGGAGKGGAVGVGGGSKGQGFQDACDGAKGGTGGQGGAGAGGAGGVSAAVLHVGPKPSDSASILNNGKKGAGGSGGKPGANDGPDGLEGPVVTLL